MVQRWDLKCVLLVPFSEGVSKKLTARINALACTSDVRKRVLKLPLPDDYIGLARSALQAPVIKFGNTTTIDMEIPQHLMDMVLDMVRDPRQHRVRLIDGEKLRTQHTSLQEQLVSHFAEFKLAVVNHNSGYLGLNADTETALYGMRISLLESYAAFLNISVASKLTKMSGFISQAVYASRIQAMMHPTLLQM